MRPDRVVIGPFTFKLVWSQPDIVKFSRTDGMDKFGISHMDTMEITIDDSRPLQAMQNTVLHEILHCTIWAFNVPVPHVDDEHKEEEEFVCRMDTVLLLLLKQNRSLFEWLSMEEENA